MFLPKYPPGGSIFGGCSFQNDESPPKGTLPQKNQPYFLNLGSTFWQKDRHVFPSIWQLIAIQPAPFCPHPVGSLRKKKSLRIAARFGPEKPGERKHLPCWPFEVEATRAPSGANLLTPFVGYLSRHQKHFGFSVGFALNLNQPPLGPPLCPFTPFLGRVLK